MNDLHVNLKITGLTDENRDSKYLAAVRHLAKAMGQPVTIRPRVDEDAAEEFAYQAQAEFTENLTTFFAGMMDDVYHVTCEYLDLPVVHTFQKGIFERFLVVKGKLAFNPETGKPLKMGDLYRLVKAIEKFLSLGITDMSKRVVLGSAALGKLMAFIEKTTTGNGPRKMTVEQAARGFNFDKISTDMKAFQETFNVPEPEMERLQVVEAQVGDWFQDLADSTLKKVKDTYYEGVIQKLPKGQIAQNLFDRFGDQNRDWRRVVETEHSEIFNNAYLKARVAEAPPGEKVYFKRREILDGHTCKFCTKIKDTIALWSDVPLDSEKIQDPVAKVAIWEGKSNFGRKAANYWVPAGTVHPHCRGSWERYTPPVHGADDMNAKVNEILARKKKRDALYNEAFREVKADMKGTATDTPAFKEALDRVYSEKLKSAGL